MNAARCCKQSVCRHSAQFMVRHVLRRFGEIGVLESSASVRGTPREATTGHGASAHAGFVCGFQTQACRLAATLLGIQCHGAICNAVLEADGF